MISYLSKIAININIFFYLWSIFLFLKEFGYLIFCTYLDLLFLWQNKTYLLKVQKLKKVPKKHTDIS